MAIAEHTRRSAIVTVSVTNWDKYLSGWVLGYNVTLSDANHSVYTKRIQYLAWKICVLYCYFQNLYFTGAQNLYFEVFLYIMFLSYIALTIKKLSRNGVCFCNKMFLLVLSVMISIVFIAKKIFVMQNIFYELISVLYNQNLYFTE